MLLDLVTRVPDQFPGTLRSRPVLPGQRDESVLLLVSLLAGRRYHPMRLEGFPLAPCQHRAVLADQRHQQLGPDQPIRPCGSLPIVAIPQITSGIALQHLSWPFAS